MTNMNFNSKAEQKANDWFNAFNEHKLLFGFIAMAVLTICSIYFNMRLGRLNASPSDWTWWIMPASYSFLDIALLCIGMALFAGAIRGLLWAISWLWFAFLLALSLWACLSCIIALDAEKASSGDAFKRQQFERALANANGNVDTWTRNVKLTVKHKSRFQDRLDQAVDQRDDLINQISKLDGTTPPSQVIFDKAEAFLPVWMDGDMFKTLSRLVFGIAMTCTPIILAAILANVLGSTGASRGTTPPNNGSRHRYTDDSNSDFARGKTERWGEPSPDFGTVAQKVEIPHVSKEDREVIELDRDALSRVREWLRSQEGRVSRRSIEHKAGTRKYAQISLIIEELLREGWLIRMTNKQLSAAKPALKAVV